MANQMLKQQFLEVVDNQLKTNNPRCTKIAFEKLLKKGYSRIQAKEIIARVIIEELHEMVKKNEMFDEEIFCKRLASIPELE